MSITDELRDCIRTANRSYEDVRNPYNDREVLHIPEEELLKIADRIDTEHESAWVKLPVDADGEPIHVGDVMENTIHPPTHREVTGVGAECFYAWEDRCGRYSQFSANCYRHYHAPTVEDVLREFADEVQRCCDTADTIAEYKKLESFCHRLEEAARKRADVTLFDVDYTPIPLAGKRQSSTKADEFQQLTLDFE